MMTRTKIIVGVLIAIVVAIGVAAYASPYRAVKQLREAAEAGDRDRLEELVDFAALRDSVKAEVSAAFVAPAMDKAKDSPYAGLGAVLAGAMIGPMVDSMVTPAGVAAMVQQGRPRPVPSGSSAPMPSAPPSTPGPMPANASPDRPKPTMGYTAMNRFVVSFPIPREGAAGEDAFRLIFLRDGIFGWKLSQVRFPPTSR